MVEHPELILGPNPLFDALAPFIEYDQLPDALLHEPLQSIDWRALSPGRREPLLSLLEKHFFPTRVAIDIAASVQLALRASIAARNPLSQREQIRINRLAIARDAPEVLLQALHNPAGGGTLRSITGMGKSVIILRTLHVITRTQAVTHEKSAACGWAKCVQITYLYIDAPSNGSRGGLLVRILEAVDALIGTDYCEDARRLRNLEAVILLLVRVLSVHRVGILVIDEQQQDNFDECPWQREFVLLFFALMNLGIAVFLCGNPLAFTNFRTSSQVVRRFSQYGLHSLVPAASEDEAWWSKELVPGVMLFAPCETVSDAEEIRASSRSASGGIPGLFTSIWRETLLIALRRGGEHAVVSAVDFKNAQDTARTRELGNIAKYITSPSVPESTYSDLPRDLEPTGGNATASTAPELPSPETVAARATAGDAKVLGAIRAAEKREKADQKKRAEKKNEIDKKLSPADMRKASNTLQLLAGLREAQQQQLALEGSSTATER